MNQGCSFQIVLFDVRGFPCENEMQGIKIEGGGEALAPPRFSVSSMLHDFSLSLSTTLVPRALNFESYFDVTVCII